MTLFAKSPLFSTYLSKIYHFYRSPSFAVKYGPLSMEKFHLKIQCLKPDPEKIGDKDILSGFRNKSQCKIGVRIVKVSSLPVWIFKFLFAM